MSNDIPISSDTYMPTTSSLPTDLLILEAEEARILVVRRNRALETLKLSEDKMDSLATELDLVGWPSDLMSIPQPIRPKRKAGQDPGSQQDMRALMCLRRHSDATMQLLGEIFFLDRVNPDRPKIAQGEPLRLKWMFLMRKEIPSWNKQNTETLLRLYQEEGKSFGAVGEAKTFGQFTAFDLELLYVQATNKRLMNKEKRAMKSGRGSGDDRSKAGLRNQRKSTRIKQNRVGVPEEDDIGYHLHDTEERKADNEAVEHTPGSNAGYEQSWDIDGGQEDVRDDYDSQDAQDETDDELDAEGETDDDASLIPVIVD
jgi:hypothetical protein